jgi:protein-tyrosine phosphatase
VSASSPRSSGSSVVLVVCTGNICRSPAAELLLRERLGADSGIAVFSAGTAARVGDGVAPPMARLLRERGLDPDGFAARQLVPGLVSAADLVLTMTADQRSAVVSTVPAALRRTFTLRELAGLGAAVAPDLPPGDPAARLTALVRAAPRGRGHRQTGPEHDDVADPYRGPDAGYAVALHAIEAAVDGLSVVLADRAADRR